MNEESALLELGILGFSPAEAEQVVKEYVCAVCHADLVSIQIENSANSIVVCTEHGNAELVGRVMKSTVSIEMERGYLHYRAAVRNLADLWPELVEEGFEYEDAVKIRKHNVCKKCGGFLVMQFKDNKSLLVQLKCQKCGSDIERDGYVRKGDRHAYSRAHQSA